MTCSPRHLCGLLAAAIAVLWLVYALSPPLQGVHWDTPIYLYKGKLAAESGLIKDIAADAGRIGQRYRWEPFWEFFRLGNVAFIGAVVAGFGATVEAIRLLHALYALMMAATLAVSYFAVKYLFAVLHVHGDPGRLSAGILVSLLLYSVSDVSFYLARSLVSEVPSLLAVSATALLLLLSQARRSLSLAIAAGLCAFVVHFVRYEAIWVVLAFAASLLLLQRLLARDGVWLRGYAAAAAAALFAFLVHSAIFFPMTSPGFFLEFAGAQEVQQGASDVAHSFASAGGLLWVGCALGLILPRCRQVLGQAGVFLLVALLPFLPFLASGGVIQTRMLAPLLFLPVLVGSSIGWTSFMELGQGVASRVLKGAILAAVALVVLVHVPWTYQALSGLPGLWRLQALKAVDRASLTVNAWEKYDYDVPQLAAVAGFLYAGSPAVVIPGAHHGTLFILRFFGDRYRPEDDFAIRTHPVHAQLAECRTASAPRDWERVLTCMPTEKGSLASVQVPGRPVEQLYDKVATGWAMSSGVCLDHSASPLFETVRYALYLCEPPLSGTPDGAGSGRVGGP